MRKLYIILLILGLLFLTGIFAVRSVLSAPNIHLENKKISYVDVPENTSFPQLKKLLSPYLISKKKFALASKIKRFSKAKPGRYALKNNMSNNRLINILRIGQQLEVNLTFNNKNSLEDLAGSISKQIAPDSTSLLKVMKDPSFLQKNGFTPKTALLMYVPDTYRFYYNTSAEKFRDKMLAAYKKFWNANRVKLAKKQGLTPVKAGILASIVQKESTKKDELARIAGVYLNRLKNNWLLEADPTVVYAYQQKYGKDIIIRRVINKHKAVVSPYNTYKNAGLPPGPICMPDVRSIEAVLHPEKHDYFFFVADFKRPGYHIFNKSLSQHNRDANKYHNKLNQDRIFH